MTNEELVTRIKSGRKDLITDLILQNKGLVTAIARSFNYMPGIELDDHIQNGTIGLINAIRTFDLSRGVLFSTYATHRIRAKIMRDGINQSTMIHEPDDRSQQKRKVKRIQAHRNKVLSVNEIAVELDISVDSARVITLMPASPISIHGYSNQTEYADIDDVNHEFLTHEDITGVCETIDDRLETIMTVVDKLSVFDRRIAAMVLGFDGCQATSVRDIEGAIRTDTGKIISYTAIFGHWKRIMRTIQEELQLI